MKDSEAMCTVVVSLAPEDRVPLLLLGVRDEFAGRPWQPPARHWPAPDWSPLIGGRDEQAGGTWLAVHPDVPRVGCILNARGELTAGVQDAADPRHVGVHRKPGPAGLLVAPADQRRPVRGRPVPGRRLPQAAGELVADAEQQQRHPVFRCEADNDRTHRF